MVQRILIGLILFSLTGTGIFAQKKVEIASQVYEHDSTINILSTKIAELEQKMSVIEIVNKSTADSIAKLRHSIKELQDSCSRQRAEILDLKKQNSTANQLIKHIEVIENDTLRKSVDFMYDEQNRLTEVKTIESTGEQYVETYTYAEDMITTDEYYSYTIDINGLIKEKLWQEDVSQYTCKYVYNSGKIKGKELYEEHNEYIWEDESKSEDYTVIRGIFEEETDEYIWDEDNIIDYSYRMSTHYGTYHYKYTNLPQFNIDILSFGGVTSPNASIGSFSKGLSSKYMPSEISYENSHFATGVNYGTEGTANISYIFQNNLITQIDVISVERDFDNYNETKTPVTTIKRKNIRLFY